MPRVKRGNKRRERRKKILSLAKGYFLTKGKLFRSAQESIMRAGNFAYAGRRLKKRDFRRLWIVRINAAARALDMSYSQFIAGLNRAGVTLDRKSLAEIAARDPKAFGALVETARKASDDAAKTGPTATGGTKAPKADAGRAPQAGPGA
jgi:large subunit ribosomal protein L20